MLSYATDGFYFPGLGLVKLVELPPAPGCPAPPEVFAMEPGDLEVQALEPQAPSVLDPSEICPPSVQGVVARPPSVRVFKPLPPITKNEDDC
jgi:hypothetical protein